MLKLEGLKSKQENGITVYFYAGLGWGFRPLPGDLISQSCPLHA